MEDKDLMRAWTGTDFHAGDTDLCEMADRICNGKRKTAIDDLKSYYRRFSIISLMMAVASVFLTMNDVIPENWRIIDAVLMSAYFATAGIMDHWLYVRISEIDVLTMKTGEVCRRAMLCRKRHHQFMMILIPMVLVVVGVFGYPFVSDRYMLGAMICGGIIGLAIGTRAYINMMRDYKAIRS